VKSLHFLFKSVLRPNFSSAKWLSKRRSQKVKSPSVSLLSTNTCQTLTLVLELGLVMNGKA